MLPKTEIRYSWVYNKQFYQEFTFEDLKQLKEDSKEFEKLFKKYRAKILKAIEKETRQWEKKYIPIYIIKAHRISFSDPLTINYRENTKFMLIMLIHELLHNNIPKMSKSGSFKTVKEVHLYMSTLIPKILNNIPLDLTEENKILDKITLR